MTACTFVPFVLSGSLKRFASVVFHVCVLLLLLLLLLLMAIQGHRLMKLQDVSLCHALTLTFHFQSCIQRGLSCTYKQMSHACVRLHLV